MYLNDVEEGGTTTFNELNIVVKPMKGDAIVFYNCKPNGDPDPLTMHSGDKVIKGTKWLAIKLINKKPAAPPQEERIAGELGNLAGSGMV